MEFKPDDIVREVGTSYVGVVKFQFQWSDRYWVYIPGIGNRELSAPNMVLVKRNTELEDNDETNV